MPRRALPSAIAIATLAAGLMPTAAPAQPPQPDEVSVSASLSGIHQFDTDLDDGGDFHWTAGIASGSLTRQFTRDFSAGLALRYDFEDWKFSHPVAFGGVAAWRHLNAPDITADFRYTVDSGFVLGAAPLFGWAFETGAKASDAMTYGVIFAATKVFSPTLMLGAGVGIMRQVEDTNVFPFLIVKWQINDQWQLRNPFAAGPAGGAGLELTYASDDRWEFGVGGTKRSTRYRLDDTGIAPGGIGENRFFPLFARVARNFGAQTRVDLYAGIALRGRLTVADAKDTTVARDDYSTAPLIGLTLAHRF